MIPPRTGKSVAGRIDVRYVARRDPFRQLKNALVAAALVAASAWLAWAAVRGDRRLYQAGPVSADHASFGQDCEMCHAERWQPLVRMLTLDATVRSVNDIACRQCHAAADHQAKQIKPDVPKCAACHREHRRRDLIEIVADQCCTACHAELKTTDGPSARFDTHVVDFARTHPEFALRRTGQTDSTAIKLNHEVHLRPDGLRGEHGERVTLQCDACHTLDAERRYMRPVTYEEHCKRCHPLTFDTTNFEQTAVPHDRPESIHDFLRGKYLSRQRQRADTGADREVEISRRLPGRATTREQDEVNATITHQIEEAEFRLYDLESGCKLCHTLTTRTGTLPTITPPKIPARWLPDSQFSHQSHLQFRADDVQDRSRCAGCHAADSSRVTSDVLIPAIESCRKCHSARGGANTNCIECHRYHDGGPKRVAVSNPKGDS